MPATPRRSSTEASAPCRSRRENGCIRLVNHDNVRVGTAEATIRSPMTMLYWAVGAKIFSEWGQLPTTGGRDAQAMGHESSSPPYWVCPFPPLSCKILMHLVPDGLRDRSNRRRSNRSRDSRGGGGGGRRRRGRAAARAERRIAEVVAAVGAERHVGCPTHACGCCLPKGSAESLFLPGCAFTKLGPVG